MRGTKTEPESARPSSRQATPVAAMSPGGPQPRTVPHVSPTSTCSAAVGGWLGGLVGGWVAWRADGQDGLGEEA